ncbi:helix-turn-helix domain-containing protein [Aneurinibacillus tyrosinisolvens]|uniref:helix-turn-helix domain-containing protein n=1 Tax=Aneurinibacillus tyrosinisolvens TaxID=1443435 RepID=UPI00063F20BC|nr:RodZ domain-containing protein [Aneurinibacillus tyrosinisolvens]
MSELADVLRRARQEKGMSLNDIQEATKIQRRYLEAIENGNFEVLPGHFYVRAFIKSYADIVGLDSEQLVSQYSAELPALPKTEQQPTPLRQSRQTRKEGTGGSSRWVPRILLCLFAVLVIALIWVSIKYAYQKQDVPTPPQPAANAPNVNTPKPDIVVPPPKTTPPVQKPAVPAPPPAAAGTLTALPGTSSTMNYELSGADKISVKVTATKGAHWLSVSDAKGQIEQLTLKEGESKSWEIAGSDAATLKVYNAKNTEVTVNGQAIDTTKAKRSSQKIKIVRKTAP